MRSKNAVWWVLIGVLGVGGQVAADEPDWKKLYEDQKKRTDALERRLAIIEEQLQAEPYVKTEAVPEATLKFLQETELSGYVSASYFWNTDNPGSRQNTGRGFDTRHNEFMANKLVLNLSRPVDYNAFEWTAGYTAQLLFGQDAEFTQASGLSLGEQGDLLQAFVEVSVPVANGFKLMLGKCATPLGYELTETERNGTWSAGYLWTLFEPFTHTGLGVSYRLSHQWEAQLLVNNGWDLVADNNDAKSFIGRLAFTPSELTTITLCGFGGPEQDDDTANWRRGVNFVMEHKCTPKLTSALQLDYGCEDEARVRSTATDAEGYPTDIAGAAQWWGAGLWLTYDFTPQFGVTMRGEYVNDPDGARSSAAPALAPFTVNTGQELCNVTLTVNYRPLEGLRLSPEIRWDHSTLDTAFDGNDDQLTLGFGAAYEF
jgi:hypothetical protein